MCGRTGPAPSRGHAGVATSRGRLSSRESYGSAPRPTERSVAAPIDIGPTPLLPSHREVTGPNRAADPSRRARSSIASANATIGLKQNRGASLQ